MDFKYTPLDLHGSKRLFTGRTEIVSMIFENLIEGRSVAIFGERQIGKTLLLWMLRDIINKTIDIEGLIDCTLKTAIPGLQEKLGKSKSIYMTLEGIGSNEDALVDRFIYKLKDGGVCVQKEESLESKKTPSTSLSLNQVFVELSKQLPKDMKLIILMDEMECLEKYSNSHDLSGVLRDASNHYENLNFVHTGSYHWEMRIRELGKKSPWNHLRKHYLGGINEIDAVNYLIEPLIEKYQHKNRIEGLAGKIIECSGCRPLLIQEVCSELYNSKDGLPCLTDLDNILIKCIQIKEYIKSNVFEEVNLKEDSKKMLKFLSHFPSSTAKRISRRLKIQETFVKNGLEDFDQHHFDTVKVENQRSRINGKLIEKYGKDRYVKKDFLEPKFKIIHNKKFRKKLFLWIMSLVLLSISVLLFIYTHPRNISKIYEFPDFKVILEVPESLEIGEEGNFSLSIQNTSGKIIESLKMVFSSTSLEYDINGRNILALDGITPLEDRPVDVKYRVRASASEEMQTSISIEGIRDPILSRINKRKFPVKKLKMDLLSYFTGIFGLLSLVIAIIKSIHPQKE